MHISKIQLENIKSHISSTYEFNRGTTAITGENGAGKTTIIEAIAWVLFDLLEYKKEDFVRRGAKKGSVTVTFESGLDEREYIVYRDSGTGYYVTDRRLQTKVAIKKEEVFRFLWQHLGLEPGTDLKSLFKQAIGVPQGTFTAIFLEGASERKAAFDRLLKVEEYRQAAEKLRETARFVDAGIVGIRERIARSEGELSRSDAVEEEHKAFQERSAKMSMEIDLFDKQIVELRQQLKTLDEQEREITKLRTASDRLKAEREKGEIVLNQLTESVQRAIEAKAKAEAAKEPYQRHVEVLGHLRELERERQQRDKLRSQLIEVEGAIFSVKADQKRIELELEALQKAHAEIEVLRPKIAAQESLERDVQTLRDSFVTARSVEAQIKETEQRIEKLRSAYRSNHERLVDAQAKAAAAGQLDLLEKREAELIRSIANLNASLERDERFQSEIKNGLCPVLSEKCLNLKEGQSLEAFVSSQFSEIRLQISGVESEHRTLASDLNRAREGAKFSTALDQLSNREQELIEEGQRLNEELALLTTKKEKLSGIEEQLKTAEIHLKDIGDPRGRIALLEAGAGREMEIRQAISSVQANLERLESDRRIVIEQMEEYRDLDANWAKLSAEREATVEPHRVFLSNQSEAETLAERQTRLNAATSELDAATAKATEAQRGLTHAEAAYDAEAHMREREKLRELEKLYVQTQSALDAAKQREDQLAAEIARFAEIRLSMRSEFQEKQRLERVAETTAFIRETLKEAAPRVARNYVYHVSIEAAQMFREITGNAEYTLKWAEDYSIVMEEDGYERPFASLSGGEQMAAALSVRLALLKQLTDIRIAFFDEPTANMDAERRENLAMQISRITHFDQLFVISHDEAFDNFVDNVISIGS